MMDQKRSTQTVDFARLYGRKGYCCVPLWHCTPDGCGCGNPVCDYPGEHPVGTVVADATGREEELIPLFARYPTPNIGIVTGSPSGIVTVSVDARVSGSADSLQRLTCEYGLTADTDAIVGSQLWTGVYRSPAGCPVLPEKIVREDFPGVCLSGEGGYVVAPPSVDPYSRSPYRWTRMDQPAVVNEGVLNLFLEAVRHLTFIPIPPSTYSCDDSRTYLKGFYQHLRSVGFPASEAAQMTTRKRSSFASQPPLSEVEAMVAKIEEETQKEVRDDISVD